jgi:hypothetical protein
MPGKCHSRAIEPRGVIDTRRIVEHWDDTCRIAVSINTGERDFVAVYGR